MPGVHQSGGVLECQVNKDAWAELNDQQKNVMREAAKLTVFDSWLAASYSDLEAYRELEEGPNEIVRLEPSFIQKIYEETAAWEDEKAKDSEWFAKVLESQRQFKKDMDSWPQYRLNVGKSEL